MTWKPLWIVCALAAPGCVVGGEVGEAGEDPLLEEIALVNNRPFLNLHGASATWSTDGEVDLDTAFTQDFGSNGRTCITCHTQREGWTISPPLIQLRFELTDGLDPLFRLVDGANSPLADDSTKRKRRAAYSMLLSRGVIRVGIGIPEGAEFELIAVDDPYGYASAEELSLFRRPLPAANLPFIPRVMWDGRVPGDSSVLPAALADQASGATLGHAQALEPPPQEILDEMVGFEIALSNAQILDLRAGYLGDDGARGGPQPISEMERVAGPFDLFDAWAELDPYASKSRLVRKRTKARLAIARGQDLFNSATNANGGRCGGCHNVANVGSNLNGTFFDVGVSDGDRRTPDLPLYTLRNIATGEIIETTDPGRALITGLWSDVNRFKAPGLRGLAARAPYFHNGS
ncbi:MAG TPA: hypothetical protein VKZ63_19650, partial [Kofleriaceae bacterium]|nr:hypothetical protein [Kofleriaceae bacterium]